MAQCGERHNTLTTLLFIRALLIAVIAVVALIAAFVRSE